VGIENPNLVKLLPKMPSMRSLANQLLLPALLLTSSPSISAQPNPLTDMEIDLCRAAQKTFGERPEQFATLRQANIWLGETQRRNGGTCNQYALWARPEKKWILVFQNLSLDGRRPNPSERSQLDRYGLTSESIQRLQERRVMLLDKAPDHWDLDIPYKVWNPK